MSHLALRRKGRSPTRQVVGQNKKAWHEYEILDKFEAGLVLTGAEITAIRDHRGTSLTPALSNRTGPSKPDSTNGASAL